MKDKIILLIDNHFWSLNHFRGYLIKYLLEQHCRVVAITPYPTDTTGTIKGVEYLYTNMERTSTSIWNTLTYFFYLFKQISIIKPDLVINFTIKPVLFGSLVCRIKSIKTISMFPGISYLFSSSSIKSKAARSFLRFAISKCCRILVLNEEDKTTLLKHQLVKDKNIQVLIGGEGVDVNSYKMKFPRVFNRTTTFIMLSRILKNKGTIDYITAAKRIKEKNVKFYLAGSLDETHPEGITKSQLNKLMGNSIEYLGAINVHEWFPKCDCFVLPSYYNEGMNRSIMEAISYQMPVITTDNKGCREMVLDKVSGFIVPKRNVDRLYEAMNTFCHLNEASKEKMGFEGRKLAEITFSEKKVLQQYLRIFLDIFG